MSKGGEFGFSILELMAVLLIIAFAAMVTMPLIYQQNAIREIEAVARKWIGHAQFARQQALLMGAAVGIAPYSQDDWSQGWVIKQDCSKLKEALCDHRVLISQGNIEPIFLLTQRSNFEILIQVGLAFVLMLQELRKLPKVDL